jgi:hypothetical protein
VLDEREFRLGPGCMRLIDEGPILLVRGSDHAVRPGASVLRERRAGLVLIAKNGDALAMRAALERHQLGVLAWYGIRVFTDHLGDEPPGDDSALAVEAEWRAGKPIPTGGLHGSFT